MNSDKQVNELLRKVEEQKKPIKALQDQNQLQRSENEALNQQLKKEMEGNNREQRQSSSGSENEADNEINPEVHGQTQGEDNNSDDSNISNDSEETNEHLRTDPITVEWMKGYEKNNENNPGKLIINGREKFIYNNTIKNILHYHCCAKKKHRCKSKARVQIIEKEDGTKEYVVKNVISDHSHNTSAGKILAEMAMAEMKEVLLKELSYKPNVRVSEIRKRIQIKYKLKYENGTEEEKKMWQECIECLTRDENIDKNLNKLKLKMHGKIPKGRNDFNPSKILEAFQESGGESVLVLDSNTIAEEEDLDDEQKRVLIFSTEKLLKKIQHCEKGSIDGTFKISPEAWTQVFLLQLKVGDKFLPVAFGLLPNKEEKSYITFFKLISRWLEDNNMNSNLKTMISDYETSIINAMKKTWNCKVLGCRFHFGQALQRWVDQNMKECLKDAEFEELFRCLLAFPMLNLEDLDDALSELTDMTMKTEKLEEKKFLLLQHFYDVWVDGFYPPELWNCYERGEDCTNNSQEAYNGVLRRTIQIPHPNPNILTGFLVTELHSSEYKLDKIMTGKQVKLKKKYYEVLHQEVTKIKGLYTDGHYSSKREYLKIVGFKTVLIIDELTKVTNNSIQEVHEENDSSDNITNEIQNIEDRIFVHGNHPYGTSSSGRSTINTEPRNKNKKKCPNCEKGFVFGKKRQSNFKECSNCSLKIHEKCTNSVDGIYLCKRCQPVNTEISEDIANEDVPVEVQGGEETVVELNQEVNNQLVTENIPFFEDSQYRVIDENSLDSQVSVSLSENEIERLLQEHFALSHPQIVTVSESSTAEDVVSAGDSRNTDDLTAIHASSAAGNIEPSNEVIPVPNLVQSQISDCGKCKYCLDKPKYGGRNKLKQRCIEKPKRVKKTKQ